MPSMVRMSSIIVRKNLTIRNVLENFFEFMREKEISYCVMGRCSDSLTRYTPGLKDIDIMIGQKNLPRFHNLFLNFCTEKEYPLVNAYRHATGRRYDIAWVDEENHISCVPIDICGDLILQYRRLVDAGPVLAERRSVPTDEDSSSPFYVTSPGMEFTFYLFKKLFKKLQTTDLSDRQGRHLSTQWHKDPSGVSAAVKRCLGDSEARLIIDAARSNNWSTVREKLPDLRRSLRKSRPISLPAFRGDGRSRVDRVIRPVGLLIAMLGVDGAGKTSVLTALDRNSSLIYLSARGRSFHLRPFFARERVRNGHVGNPHALPARGVILSIAKLLLWLVDYYVSYTFCIFMQKVGKRRVVFDRYYHDILVDPCRYRYGGPMWLARWVGKLIPKPDLWILLDAPHDVIQARKRDVSLAETVRQSSAYLELVHEMNNAVVVDSSQPLDKVVADVTSAILATMVERTKRRHETESYR